MILDAQLQFSDSQAVTADARSTNIIDLGVARKLFKGEPMVVMLQVEVAADNTTGDEAYEVQLETDSDSAFGSPTDLAARSFTAAQLGLNKRVFLPVPLDAPVERYLSLFFNVGGTTPSVTVSAYLVPQSFVDTYETYPDASPIQ